MLISGGHISNRSITINKPLQKLCAKSDGNVPSDGPVELSLAASLPTVYLLHLQNSKTQSLS